MSVPDHRDVPPRFALRSGHRLFVRHLLATTITILVVVAAWIVVTAPIVAVFVADDAASGYVETALEVAGRVSVATLVITPVAVGLERLVRRGGRVWTVLAVLLPVALVVAVAACFVAMVQITGSKGAGAAVAVAALLMFILAVYWPALWALNLAGAVLSRVHQEYQRRRGSRPAPGHDG